MDIRNIIKRYADDFSAANLARKVARYGKRLSRQGVYSALLLYYAFHKKETPAWAKNIVRGALGYFISPIDLLPDLTPVLGYTDDMGVLAFGLSVLAVYIDDGVKAKSRLRLNKWMGSSDDDSDLDDVDRKVDERK